MNTNSMLAMTKKKYIEMKTDSCTVVSVAWVCQICIDLINFVLFC